MAKHYTILTKEQTTSSEEGKFLNTDVIDQKAHMFDQEQKLMYSKNNIKIFHFGQYISQNGSENPAFPSSGF